MYVIVTSVGLQLFLSKREDGGREELAGLVPRIEQAWHFRTYLDASEMIRKRYAAYREHGKACTPLEVREVVGE